MPEINDYHDGSLLDYVAVIRRQKWIFALALVLVPTIAVMVALRQAKSYEATAQALLGGQDLAGTVNGVPSVASDADRFAQTQVNVARLPIVASETLRAAHVRDRTAEDLLAHSSVVAKGNANVLDFSVTDTDPALAQKLVNAYVHEFAAYRARLDAAPLARALRQVRSKIAELERENSLGSPLIAALRSKESQLETAQQVQDPSVRVLQDSTGVTQVSPRPTFDALLGVILGLVLGTALAFGIDSLGARARSPEEIVDVLGVPLLGVVPGGSSRAAESAKPVMLGEPEGAAADAVRRLKTKLALANVQHQARVIMFTSAVNEDGKLAVVTNLALAFARSNRRVILVDFDLRHGSLLRFMGRPAPRGVTDVVSGAASVDQALAQVSITPEEVESSKSQSTRGLHQGQGGRTGRVASPDDATLRAVPGLAGKAASPTLEAALSSIDAALGPADGSLVDPGLQGGLQILSTGSTPPRISEFVEMERTPKMFDDLRMRSDLVLVNAPPFLRVSDGMTLATMVDAIVVVASAREARRPDLSELHDALAALPAVTLGVVLTEVNGNYGSLGGYSLQISVGPAPSVSSRASNAPAST
jgi:Mrp family chromosome partitioning ATPase/capsular polysaccharide biosynthesis protein